MALTDTGHTGNTGTDSLTATIQNEADAPFLGDVLVLGAGRTGLAAASYLAKRVPGRVSSVTLVGGTGSFASDATRALEEAGVDVRLATEDIEGTYDLCVASPGIPNSSAFCRAARAAASDYIGEPELAWRESPERWIAITGTNGKTTTTTLTTELLRAAGLDALAVGNIGRACIGEVDAREPGSWFVAELSSFQLDQARLIHPHVACLLNVTPDHLEWHGSLEAYVAAKERIFSNLDAGDLAVVCVQDDYTRSLAASLEGRGLVVCRVAEDDPAGDNAGFVHDGRLVVRLSGAEHVLAGVDELQIKGAHNVMNALVAAACALFVGASADAVCEGLVSFAPLEHRIEPCGEAGGITFVNDSKATNVDAVVQALGSFEPGSIVCLLGGHDKGTSLDALSEAVGATCKAAVCYGEAGPRIADALEAHVAGRGDGRADACAVIRVAHMADALEAATALARPGDTVLLSPACSSFDEFKSYGERGRRFKQLVADIVGEVAATVPRP